VELDSEGVVVDEDDIAEELADIEEDEDSVEAEMANMLTVVQLLWC
jgi:hypothetical protein